MMMSRCRLLVSGMLSELVCFEKDQVLCGPSSCVSGWNHNRNKITVELKRPRSMWLSGPQSVAFLQMPERGWVCLRFSRTGGQRLCLKAPESTHLPHRRGPSAARRRADVVSRLGAWPGFGPLIPEHWLLSSHWALYCSCQMALHFKSRCLSIRGKRRESAQP